MKGEVTLVEPLAPIAHQRPRLLEQRLRALGLPGVALDGGEIDEREDDPVSIARRLADAQGLAEALLRQSEASRLRIDEADPGQGERLAALVVQLLAQPQGGAMAGHRLARV